MIFPIVVPMNVDVDVLVDLSVVLRDADFVTEKSFQSFLERAEFSQCLRMVDTGPNVFFIDMLLAVFTNNFVLSVELGSVVGQEIVVSDFQEFLHSSYNGFIFLICESQCPSSPGVIIFHGENGYPVKHGEISLDELIRTSPFKPFPFLLCPLFRFNDTSSYEYSGNGSRVDAFRSLLIPKADIYKLRNRKRSEAGFLPYLYNNVFQPRGSFLWTSTRPF